MERSSCSLCVAFGGGGAPALASLGVMSVLSRHNIAPAAVAGTSMGAAIAAYYGVHGETETLRRWFEERSIKDYALLVRLPRRWGLIGTVRLERLVEEMLGFQTFASTRVPVRIVATDIGSGERKVFSEGALAPAVIASGTIPGFFAPYQHCGRSYIDGIFADPTPVSAYPVSAYDYFLALDYHLASEDISRLDPVSLLVRAGRVASHAAFEYRMREHLQKTTVIAPNNAPSSELLRFDRAKEFIRSGEIAGQALVLDWQEQGLCDAIRGS